ncbi:TonB-dependent receptor [Acidicapsa dinghuensis]|uniref:TonB-dependent receptor n=1 Tax=Acidicapsa dinghuensis TaxID=2218256 RepID=A0ABW1EBT8_9BACT|nr:TonB-dependent receptor [Acidicapsa dinghuensis]
MKSKTFFAFRPALLLVSVLLVSIFVPRISAQTKGVIFGGTAQNQAGSISGTLTDSAGAVLRGAQVSVPAKGLIVSTDEQGRFFFSGLQSGDYEISVSYIGFQKLTKTVTVNAGISTLVSLQLQVASNNQSVLVTATSASAEVEAVNEERAADNLIQVMPSQTITSLPDRNLGDAIGRMASVALTRNEGQDNFVAVRGTEPRLNNTTVDGFNMPSEDPGIREFDFFAVPTGIVDSVKVSKTLEANMDGDGIGGSINLVTKTASDTPTYQITAMGGISAMGGYTPIENARPNANVYGTWGRRFGANKKLGFIIGGEYDFDGTGYNDVEPTPDMASLANNQTVVWDDSQDLRTYMFHRPRYGSGGSLDYRIKPGSTIFLRYLYTFTRDSGDKSVYSLFDNTPGVQLINPGNTGCATNTTTGATAPPCNTPPRYYNQAEDARIYSDSIQLSGTHVLTNTWYSWSAAVGAGYFGDNPFESGNFTDVASTSSCQFNQGATTDYHLPQWTPACFAEINSPQNYAFTGTQREPGHEEQINIGVQGSGAFRWHLGGHLSTFEYGAKFRSMHKYNNQYNDYANYAGAGAGVPMTNFPNQLTQPNYYNGAYKDGYNVWFGAVQNYVNQHPADFAFSNDKGVNSANYGLVEHIPAFYVMNTTDFSNGVRLVLGLRAEITTENVHNLAFDPNGDATPNHFSGSYYDLLPSASLRFNAGRDSYMRLIYARGVSRPEEQWLAEDVSWGTGGNGAYKNTVAFGNPNLKAETGDDIDVLYEHYFKTFGVLSGGYFFKYLSLPPVSTQKVLDNYLPPGAPSSDQGTYLATYYINAGSAWISGIELQYLQHWSNLPGFLGGLGMNANYSYIGSQTSGIAGRSDKPRLLEDAPNLFNIGPTYNRGPLAMQMNINFNGASIYQYQYADGAPGGLQGPLGDYYNYPHTQVDAQGSYVLPHGLKLIVSGLNLTNEEFGFYYGSQKYDTQREFYHPTYSFGVSWSPQREK